MSGVVEGAVEFRAISISAKLNDPDLQPASQQCRCRNIEPEIAQGEVGSVAVGDVDPVDCEVKGHYPMKPFHRDGEIRTAHGLCDGLCQPRLPDPGLQHAKGAKQNRERLTECGAQPAKDPCDRAHQKA